MGKGLSKTTDANAGVSFSSRGQEKGGPQGLMDGSEEEEEEEGENDNDA